MAGFNWFNRFNRDRTNEQPSDESPDQLTDAAEEKVDSPAEASTATPSAPSVNEDYLAWAKAAYANIKQQQTVTTVEESATQESVPVEAAPVEDAPVEATGEGAAEPSLEEVVSADEPEGAAIEAEVEAIAPALEESAEQIPEPTEDLEVAAEPVPEPPSVAELTQDSPQTSSSPESAPAPLPFWAQADAERQQRLERIKAEAIEEPEPEPVATSISSPTVTQPSEEDLDENFLWSAQVLAAQGYRPEDVSLEEITWLKRLRQGLDKTRRSLVNQLRAIVGQGPLNDDAVMEIESLLLQADVGIEATDYIISALQTKLRQEALPPAEAIAYLKQILRDMLDEPYREQYNPNFAPEKDQLNIWLITGVNGAGKTTTIGKLAHLASKSEYRCLIAAADTFRAAAVEQVKVWGQRSNVEVIANPGKNTDPAAVVYDAIASASSRNTELLLVDTAGRLQNKKNLMDELNKIRRIIDKKASEARIESLLVLDSTLGQNGLKQAEVFAEAAQLTGVILTKLDGTAKGGIALAVVQQLGLPIRFIGAGEGIEDLRPFSSYEFVEALLNG
jgi:fused signal recognition particle receptor